MGQTIAGVEASGVAAGARYHLVSELGRGATGVVYLSRDVELERDVAIKLLHPHLSAANRAGACSRFFEEARISASLRHPNIMAVLDLDERARRIVMELAGGTLRQVLRERGPRTLRRALERHTQILSALAAAHRRGVVHRDLKPSNLMFRRDPDAPGAEVVLGDFGVAHLPDAQGATGADAATAKKSVEAVGTLAYMAPEQRLGAGADPRSDLYAAAVVLYEMLTGTYPWTRDTLLAGVRAAGDFRLAPTLLRAAPDDLSRMLTEHLDSLGAPDPERRPSTLEALEQARAMRAIAIAESRGLPGQK
jgi:serine/threonine-protein kinase